MQLRALVVSLLFAIPVFAQPMEIVGPLTRYEARVTRLSAEVKRDTFIVAQLVAATRDLNDFQKMIAIQKAGDRIAAAKKRASEDQPAPISTQQTLDFLQDPLIKHALEQGTMADTAQIGKEILLRSGGVQTDLFRELDTARRERQALSDIQAKLLAVDQQLDGAVMEALGASFDFVRAGGK
ncbi:MAG: hypothetical protein ACXVJT_15595 [Thermoanaerobaculia bacterium]